MWAMPKLKSKPSDILSSTVSCANTMLLGVY